MGTPNVEKIEAAVRSINAFYRRVLVADLYDGYELRKLIESLSYLLDEAEKK